MTLSLTPAEVDSHLTAKGFVPVRLYLTRTTTTVVFALRSLTQAAETRKVKMPRSEAKKLADWVLTDSFGSAGSHYAVRIPDEEAKVCASQALKLGGMNFNYLGENKDEPCIFAEGAYQGCGWQWAAIDGQGRVVATVAHASCWDALSFEAFGIAARAQLARFGRVESGMASGYTWSPL